MREQTGKQNSGKPETNNFNAGEHLTDEEIAAYQYGAAALPAAERGAQNHLIECRRCTNQLLELNAFAESIRENSAAPFENTDVEWARFENLRRRQTTAADKVAAEKAAAQIKSAAEPRRNFFGFLSFRFAAVAGLGLLAMFFFGAALLTFQNSETTAPIVAAVPETSPPIEPAPTANSISQPPPNNSADTFAAEKPNRPNANRNAQNQAAATRSTNSKTNPKVENGSRSIPPRKTEEPPALEKEEALNTNEFSLYPDEAVRGADDLRVIRLKEKSGGQVRLKLNAPASKQLFGFSLEIVDSRDNTILMLPIVADKRGDFSISIPADKLSADRYSLKIYTDQKNARRLFTIYSFKLDLLRN